MTILKIIPDFENKTAECVGYPSAGEHVDVRIVGAANLLPSPTLRFRVKFGHVTLALFPRPDVNEVWETEGSDLKCHLNLNTVQARSVCRTGNTVCHAILDQLGDDEHTVEPTLFFDDLFDVTPWCRESGADEPYDLDRYPNQIADLNQRVNEIGGKIAEAKNAAEEAAGSARAAYESAQSAVEAAQSANARANAAESAARGASADALRARNDADAAVEAISRTPRIDETTHRWMVWDAEHGEFVDTGVSAIGPQGEKGDDGITPHIGSNGHWFVGTTDTGISAQGPKGDKGEKGEPGESAILDDTVTETSENGVKSSGIWSWVKSLLPSWLTPTREEPPTQAAVAAKYTKPSGGIPSTDMTQAVQTSLALVPTAAKQSAWDAKADQSDIPELAAPSESATDAQAAKAKSTYDFVNSSINAMAAFYITKNAAGDSFATKAELTAAIASGTFYNGGQPRVPTKNDYLYILADESHPTAAGTSPTTRYSFDGTQWAFQIVVNDTALTAAQLAAMNSGINAALVSWLSQFKGSDTATTLASVLNEISYRLIKPENWRQGYIAIYDAYGELDTGLFTVEQLYDLITEKIDKASLAPEYSSTLAYTVGQYVFHSGNIYRCTTAIAAPGEVWNPAHWSAAQKLDDFFKESNGFTPPTTVAGALQNSLLEKSIVLAVTKNFADADTTAYGGQN